MFSILQALRLARASCARYAGISREANVTGALRHVRLAHEDGGATVNRRELGKLDGKMRLMFTCKKCNTRTSKLISKQAYDKGVVIVRCDGCKNNHLIADNLGWFSEITKKINIEKLMALKGETVRKIMNDVDGYYEAVLKEEQNQSPDLKMIEKSKGS